MAGPIDGILSHYRTVLMRLVNQPRRDRRLHVRIWLILRLTRAPYRQMYQVRQR